MSSVRSTRTRFRQFVFREMRVAIASSQSEKRPQKRARRDKNVIDSLHFSRLVSDIYRFPAVFEFEGNLSITNQRI
jgi:hypothetical protein